jgi:quercetin dioxygenase-like cupin family protein
VSARSRYVVRAEDVPTYSPGGHTGTVNRRLVGAKENGARFMEIVLGDVEANAGVHAHAHPGMEQAQYILEGEARVEIEGEVFHVRPGDLCFFPADVFHAITVTSARMKTLIVYAPPYGESPDKVVRKHD